MLNNQESLNEQLAQNKNRRWREYPGMIFLFITLAIIGALSLYGAYRLGFGSNEISINNGGLWGKVSGIFLDEPTPTPTSTPIPLILKNKDDYVNPEKEKDRLDILILGMRGHDDPDPNQTGAYLTDTIILLSVDKTTKKASLVSVPRDLYIILYPGREDKLNSVYEIGLARKQGLEFTRKLMSQITGVYIDHVVVFDFSAFKTIVDDLGGIDITLDKAFVEPVQWGYPFELPAGENHLDGENALYFVRSRYSSSDFDRAQRQQKVLLAIVDKVKNLNIFSDPGTALAIANTVRKNIDTDLDILDAATIIGLANDLKSSESSIKKETITTENLVYESRSPIGAYILLPVGDNFSEIKSFFKNIIK